MVFLLSSEILTKWWCLGILLNPVGVVRLLAPDRLSPEGAAPGVLSLCTEMVVGCRHRVKPSTASTSEEAAELEGLLAEHGHVAKEPA